MGWLQKLVETYDICHGAGQFENNPLPPISHTPKQAHIEIAIDEHGNFRRARILKNEQTLIPATEASAGRTSTAKRPHPLCDKLHYVAADYPAYGGLKPSLYAEYLEQLTAWCQSSFAHPKAQAVLSYVRRGHVVRDLIKAGLLSVGEDERLVERWAASPKGVVYQGDIFIRWEVEVAGDPRPMFASFRSVNELVAGDPELQSAWIKFNYSTIENKGLCMASGAGDTALAANHSKGLRYPGDGAKLISANDKAGFTFRGRFTDETGEQACSIGYDASQKVHIALRWLIARQAYRNGDQVVLAWSVGGEEVPDPVGDHFVLFGTSQMGSVPSYEGDAGQLYALKLRERIRGYRSRLPPSTSIVVMALDSATPGRLSIVFYREFGSAEFLDRVEAWHEWFAWPQDFGKDRKFVGAPSPVDIAEAIYGRKLDDKLKKACVERLLPCVIESQTLPRDLVDAAFRRSVNRVGLKHWEWEKTLGVACALFRGYQHQTQEGVFAMALEPDRDSRDYLFGRLLAYAEHIEQRALYLAKEQRDTHAAKLMQRFADHPSTTWQQISGQIGPAKSRLRSNKGDFLYLMEQQVDQIFEQFRGDDFISDRKLKPEFLLGYHCQRAELNRPKPKSKPSDFLNPSDQTEET